MNKKHSNNKGDSTSQTHLIEWQVYALQLENKDWKDSMASNFIGPKDRLRELTFIPDTEKHPGVFEQGMI